MIEKQLGLLIARSSKCGFAILLDPRGGQPALAGLGANSSESMLPLAPAGHALQRRCVDAIRSRFHEHKLSASEVAAACGISLRTLHRAFAAQGTSFACELMRERTAPAARMLAERRFRNLTVAEIGRRCGFADGSHFARQFRRWHGQGPGEFRRADLYRG